jgi:hypothetical protein
VAGGAAGVARGDQYQFGRALGEIAEWLNYDIPREIVG